MSLYDKFCEDIEKYLQDKLPQVPQSTATEIGEYISNRTSRLVAEMYIEYEEQMDKRSNRYWERLKRSKPAGDS